MIGGPPSLTPRGGPAEAVAAGAAAGANDHSVGPFFCGGETWTNMDEHDPQPMLQKEQERPLEHVSFFPNGMGTFGCVRLGIHPLDRKRQAWSVMTLKPLSLCCVCGKKGLGFLGGWWQAAGGEF